MKTTKQKRNKPGPKGQPKKDKALFRPILISDVPIDLWHRTKSEAAAQGLFLKEFLVKMLRENLDTRP